MRTDRSIATPWLATFLWISHGLCWNGPQSCSLTIASVERQGLTTMNTAFAFRIGLWGTAALLAACATPSPPAAEHGAPAVAVSQASAWAQDYAGFARAGGHVFTLDPAASRVRILVFRGGRAARLGHNHVLSAPHFTGFAYIPESGLDHARFDLEFRLDELRFDEPSTRAESGEAFSSVLSEEAIAATREHMLEADDLDADRYPFVRIQSLQVTGALPRVAARLRLTLHGQSRELAVPLQVDGLPDRLQVSGRFVLRQSDYGIRPYSIGAGLLSVEDDLLVDFLLEGR